MMSVKLNREGESLLITGSAAGQTAAILTGLRRRQVAARAVSAGRCEVGRGECAALFSEGIEAFARENALRVGAGPSAQTVVFWPASMSVSAPVLEDLEEERTGWRGAARRKRQKAREESQWK